MGTARETGVKEAGETGPLLLTGRRAFLAWAELTGFWAIVFSQQSFQRIASGPEAYTAVGADRLDVLLVIVLVALLPPTVAWLVEIAIWRLGSGEAARIFHAALFGATLAVFYWQFAVGNGLPAVARFLPAVLLLAGGCHLYLRARVVKQFAELLSLATPIVIAVFCLTYPTIDQLLPQRDPQPIARIKPDTPVVMVVFDEFPLDNLLNQRGSIDSRLFPEFARLAESSTWYSQARGVAPQTLLALPTIMTGSLPDPDPEDPVDLPVPSPRNFPDNLCGLLAEGGYRLHTRETITEFCGSRNARISRLTKLVTRSMVPGVIPPGNLLPRIGTELNTRLPEPISDAFAGRKEDLDRFIEGIDRNPRTFNFMHSVLPHQAWMYLPDGATYMPDLRLGLRTWSRPARERAFQQVMIQTSMVDRKIGRLIARMRSAGIWDRSLFIVTADHGIDLSFGNRPVGRMTANDMRSLVRESAGAILPVPLFVKFPGQKRGRIDRAEVTSADLAPTILGQLGVTLPDRTGVDGRPLGEEHRDPAGPVVAYDENGPVRTSRRQYNRVRRQAQALRDRLFGNGSFYALGGHPELIGRPVAVETRLTPLPGPVLGSPTGTPGDPKTFAGRWVFRTDRPTDPRAAVAIAVNGKIAATARPMFDPESSAWTVGTVLPDTAFSTGANEVRLYAIG
ncbi:MAG: sulfatase-like hydrolase/transferase [Solirubrobacterales bacterium]|nr:sulfatase-like hydrolase/transferase [Solirubrobacterales bacterium]